MSLKPATSEAVAIIGMSCRYAPDLNTPSRLWDALLSGSSSVSEMPDKRWDAYGAASPQATAVLRKTTRVGSFLDDIEGFDADFFGITPKEAAFLDPQQRLLLELAWEALNDAGLPPTALRGTDAGVYMSANSNDYGRRLLEDITQTGAWAVNGTTYYGMANRISYFLDLRGPSMAVDTACAGSLTALHTACQALDSGEIPVALVGGANVMATPALFVALDAAGATSPDGRSKAFADNADGYGRGEGLGVVVLKRLSDAQRDGDPILAIIRGSGVFQDGRSDGMMAPNGDAQEHMLRTIYQRCGIAPSSVDYVEAHGTGTQVGDREEAQALAAVFGENRAADDPCLIGSVKPNIGHTEAGSGLAGVIKCVLALRNEVIPPSLHDKPSSTIDWAEAGLRLVGEAVQWPSGGQPRRAGISSYGVGGSISHVVIEEAPPQDAVAPATDQDGARVLPLSAQSDAGLADLAAQVSQWLVDHPEAPLADVAHTLGARRTHLPYRAAVTADSTAQLAESLLDLQGAQVKTDRAPTDGQPLVWVFSGHGAQWSGMGRQLLNDEPEFACVLDNLGDIYRSELGWTPRELLTEGGPWTSVQVQALTFAVQVGLTAVWRARGVQPDAIIGHSVGEIAAAVAAGSLSIDQAARFACRRAASLEPIQGAGRMALVSLTLAEAQELLSHRDDVVIGISAGPSQTVLSGDPDAVEALERELADRNIPVWQLNSDIAFHSPHVDECVAGVGEAAKDLIAVAPVVPLYTTALDDPREQAPRSGSYWETNLRARVQFDAAMAAAIEDGYRLFLEIAPHSILRHSILECLDDAGETGEVIVSGRRDTDEVETLNDALASLYVHGATVDWAGTAVGNLLDLPSVAWQHKPYWIFPDNASGSGTGGGHDPQEHTLLGGCISVSGAPPRRVWQTYLDMDTRPYPQDHRVVDVEITPAAVLINTFTQAAGGESVPGLKDIVLRTPLSVTPPRVVQVVIADDTVRLSTRIAADDETENEVTDWITHCTARIDRDSTVPVGRVDVDALRTRCPDQWDWQRVDDMFRRMGVGGYAFHWDVDDLRRNETEQLAVLQIEPSPATHAHSWAQVIDGALTISAVLVTPEYAKHQWMSSHIDSITFEGLPPARIAVHSVRNATSPTDTVDVIVSNVETGSIVCQVKGLTFSAISDIDGDASGPRDLVHEVAWRELDLDTVTPAHGVSRAIVIGTGRGADWATRALTESHVQVESLSAASDLTPDALASADVVLVAPEAVRNGERAEEAAERVVWDVAETAQVLVSHAAQNEGSVRLWPVTTGVRNASSEASIAYSTLWGTGRILAGEHPQLWGGVIDLDENADPALLVTVLNSVAGQEDTVHLGADGASVSRLAPMERPTDGATVVCRATDTYLVTGGLGALGLHVARWLVDRGARRLVLNSRAGLPPRATWDQVTDQSVRARIKAVQELEALGVTVRAIALDITDADAVERALDPETLGLPPIRGIVHAAGAVDDALVENVDRDSLRNALSAKAAGVMVLNDLFPVGSLDFFVQLSSCGQFARLTGQHNYAAANSFLDGLAAYRRNQGEASVSLGWTAWRGVGMSEDIGTTMLEANSRGLEAVTAAEAARAWTFADRFDAPYLAILKVLPMPPGSNRPSMLRDLESQVAGATTDDGFTIDWENSSREQAEAQVLSDIRGQVAAELNMDPDTVDERRPLVEMGVDSVMTVALRIRLQQRFAVDLPPNILWAQPTVKALAGHITDKIAERCAAAEVTVDADVDDAPIAV